MLMDNANKIDNHWEAEALEDWAYECKLGIFCLQTALPLPNFPCKKLNKFHEAFTSDTTAWPLSLTMIHMTGSPQQPLLYLKKAVTPF